MPGIREGRVALGTIVTVELPETPEGERRELSGAVFAEIARIEKLLSVFTPGSEVWQLNHGGRCEPASPETLEVLKRAIFHSEISGGAFDVTAAPAAKAAGGQGREGAGERADYRCIRIEEDRVWFATAGMTINLGAIAKGYAVDQAVGCLVQAGVKRGLVNAGGDLRVFGPAEQAFKVGIRNPRSRGRIIAAISVCGQAVASSGTYQRFAHDIVDPHTGNLCTGILSTSVVADTAMDADALATSAYVLGPERGSVLIETQAGCAAMWVLEDGSVVETPRWKAKRLRLDHAAARED